MVCIKTDSLGYKIFSRIYTVCFKSITACQLSEVFPVRAITIVTCFLPSVPVSCLLVVPDLGLFPVDCGVDGLLLAGILGREGVLLLRCSLKKKNSRRTIVTISKLFLAYFLGEGHANNI